MSTEPFTVQLAALAPLMSEHIKREISAAVAEAQAEGRSHAVVDIGLTDGAQKRASLYFRREVSSDEADIENGAGGAFIKAWCLGEREAMRRVMVALSMPEAKGREVEVLAALMGGASIIEALRRPEPPQIEPAAEGSNVIALPRQVRGMEN